MSTRTLTTTYWKPYSKLGGNGTAGRIMKEVDKLPIRRSGTNLRKNSMEKPNEVEEKVGFSPHPIGYRLLDRQAINLSKVTWSSS